MFFFNFAPFPSFLIFFWGFGKEMEIVQKRWNLE